MSSDKIDVNEKQIFVRNLPYSVTAEVSILLYLFLYIPPVYLLGFLIFMLCRI
jgi:hypothetical protein